MYDRAAEIILCSMSNKVCFPNRDYLSHIITLYYYLSVVSASQDIWQVSATVHQRLINYLDICC